MSLYGMYEYHNIINPSDIKLFIQPGEEAQLIEQDYSYDQLKVLWLKVLYVLGDNAPDEIKVEEFKNSFINDFKKPEPIKKKKSIIFVTNPSKKIIDTLLNEVGCVLYDLVSSSILISNDQKGVTKVGIDFYFNNKKSLGMIRQAQMKNGDTLLLISDSRIMKLSGFSCGKRRGAIGYSGLLEVLSDAGFDISNQEIFNQENLTIFPKSL